jgi:hypothetical protein
MSRLPRADNTHVLMHDPKERKLLPPFSGSPFGDFPPDYNNPSDRVKRQEKKKRLQARQAAQAEAAKPHEFLHRGEGSGGLCSSTLKGKSAAQGKPPKAGAFQKKPIPPTEFRRFYERGDLPVTIQHRSDGRTLSWKVDIEKLDLHHYLPIFFDGLRELEEPYKFIAAQGCADLLAKGGSKILPTIPQLIIPIKTALNTKNPDIVCSVLKVLQKLVVSGELIGESLVPYYRQILPVLNLFKSKNLNLGDGIEYGQRRKINIGDLIHETLQLLEMHGGEDAFINIKYMVPTYESCVFS